MSPVIPGSSEKILDCLGLEKKDFKIDNVINNQYLKTGFKIKKTDILYKKIEDDN